MEKVIFGELDQYLFGQGTHYDIYKKMGAHPMTLDGHKGFILPYGRPMQRAFLS